MKFVELLKQANAQHGVISSKQAGEIGFGYQSLYRCVQSGKLDRDLPGVYRIPGSPMSWESRLMAAQLWLDKPDACASHRSAAALWAIPGFPRGPVELSSSQWKNALPPIVVHKLSLSLVGHTTTVGPIRVTNPGRTLLDVSPLLSRDGLEAAIENALRRRLTSAAHLEWLCKDRLGPFSKNVAVLRSLLGSDQQPTESELETRLLQALRKERLPAPVRQHAIRDGDEFVGRVDFAYPWAKVAIEADSYQFHSGRQDWERDLARRNRLTALGWLVIHVTHRQISSDMAATARRIRDALSPSLLQ